MRHVMTVKKNKRGKPYNTRPTKLATGIMKHYGNGGKVPDKMLRLAVYGTNDELAKQRFDIIWITVCHPIDRSYTKRVAILAKNRGKFIDRMPIEERRKIIFNNK